MRSESGECLTKGRLSVEISLLKTDFFKAQLHYLVDGGWSDVGDCQSTAEPVEHCS